MVVEKAVFQLSEPVFVNVYGAQESIPELLTRFTNTSSEQFDILADASGTTFPPGGSFMNY